MDARPDAPAITLVVAAPIAIALSYLIIKGIRWSLERRAKNWGQKLNSNIELGCLVTWWLLALVWSPSIGFGISIIYTLVEGFSYNIPVIGILIALGCSVAGLLAGWGALELTFILADNE